MAEELRLPAVALPPVRQIKCFQLFSGDDGGASGVGSGVAAAWSFCLLGFGTDGGRISFWSSEAIPSSLGIILFLFVSSSTTAVSSPAKIE